MENKYPSNLIPLISHNLNEIIYVMNNIYLLEYGKLEFLSENTVSILGYPLENYFKSNDFWFSITHPSDLEHLKFAYHQLKFPSSKTEKIVVSYRLKKNNGDYIWFEDHLSGVYNKAKKLVQVVGIIVNINERKLRESYFDEDQLRYRNIIDLASDAIFVCTENGEMLDVNSKLTKILSYTREELMCINAVTLIAPYDYVKNPINIEELRKGKSIINKRILLDKNNKEINVECNSKMMPDGTIVVIARDISERIESHLANQLREFIINNAPEIMLMLNSDGKVVFANTTACSKLEYSIEEIYKISVFDFDSNLTAEYWKNGFEKLKKIKQHTIKRINKTKSGKLFPVEITESFFEYNNKEVVCVFIRDLTEKLETEQKLVETEKKFQILSEKSEKLIFNLDLKTDKLTWSGNLKEFLSYDFEEFRFFTTKDLKQLLHKDDLFFNHNYLNNLKATEDIVNLELKFKSKLDSYKNIYINGIFLKNEVGDRLSLVGTAEDITEKKIQAERNKKNEEQLSVIYHSSSEAIGLIAIEQENAFRLESLNTAHNKIFDIDPKIHQGKLLQDLSGSPFYHLLKDKISDTILLIKSINFTYVYQANKIKKILDVTFTPILNSENRCSYIQYIARDITEKQALEEQLIQAQKMESMGTLAAGIAHDFNNLLAMILLSAELIEDMVKDNLIFNRATKNIVDAAHRGSSIAKQLLLFARPDHQDFSVISNVSIIEGIQHLFSHFLPKNITLTFLNITEKIYILGNTGQIHQCILNLVINARDAMPNGGSLIISLESEKEYKESHSLHKNFKKFLFIRVTDTGEGMSDEVKKNIFNPFFTTKEHGKGTGLGLSMVQSIVNNHRGFIWADSVLGKGTEFTILLPLVELGNEKKQELIKKHSIENLSVLVVDDEEIIRETLKVHLVKLGCSVQIATDGNDALKLLHQKTHKFDLMISDLGMPNLNGKQLIKELKHLKSEIKVIASTGYLDFIGKKELLDMGFNDVITKPYKFREIEDIINKVMTR